ncbi:unnamed protein product [Orchesella dallaii]|uniref:Cytochrome P450 9e2 n=1 Tax=Orchesella dallaii TaxID=48710 RepID=A0ABP1QUC7_9HEXA
MDLLNLLLGVALILVLSMVLFFFFQFRSHAKFFEKHGIPYLGAGLHRIVKLLMGSSTMVDVEVDIYKDATSKAKGGLVGISDLFGTVGVYLTDLELIKNVYVKDFDHFVNRRPVKTQHSNFYFKKMLFVMESEQWKGIRTKLSPTFTTGKIRRMFSIFESSSDRMANYVKEQVGATGGDFDLNLAFPKYAMDVIASCAFGVDSKCFDVSPDKMSIFEDMGKRFQFNLKPFVFLKFIFMMALPKLADLFGMEVMDTVPQSYFAGVIKHVMKRRRQTGERADDFLQLMMDAQEGLLKIDDDTNEVLNGTTEKNVLEDISAVDKQKITFDDDDIIANCLLFMLGGFDTTQSLLLFAVYQLALEKQVQEKVYKDVKTSVDANGGAITYDGLLNMTYLDMFLNETLRFFPPAPRTERICTKDYPVPGTNIMIEKGTLVAIPIYPIQRDPNYFENPEKFEPERFTVDQKSSRNPYAFMPFGHGPRNCIGMRFALTEVKAVIAKLVLTFQFGTCQKTTIPMDFDKNTNLKPKYGMWLRVTPRS